MIKGILFDLDGVLVSTQNLQVLSTLDALKQYCKINNNIRALVKQTITTQEKLKILAAGKYFKQRDIIKIYNLKKKIFNENILKKKLFSKKIFKMFQFLKINGFKLALVTNSNEKTCKIILNKLKIKKFFDIIVTNNSNIKPKPNPAPYLFAMSSLKLKKENCLILEDSFVGLLSAQRSGAKYHNIKNSKIINSKYLRKLIEKYQIPS